MKEEDKALIQVILKKNGFNFRQQSLKDGYLMNQPGVLAAEKSCQEVLESERKRIRKKIKSMDWKERDFVVLSKDELISLLSPTIKPTT